MARLLVYLRSNPSVDPGAYHRGDFVDVIPPSHDWGRLATLPRFVRIELQGVTDETARKYIEPDMEALGVEPDGVPDERMRNRRRFRLLFDSAPVALRQLVKDRDVGIDADTPHLVIGPTGDYTWRQVRAYVHNRVTNRTEEQEGVDL